MAFLAVGTRAWHKKLRQISERPVGTFRMGDRFHRINHLRPGSRAYWRFINNVAGLGLRADATAGMTTSQV
jgi:hypothetical protein